MAVQVQTAAEVAERLTTLRSRLQHQHAMMTDLDPWRHLDISALEDEIWDDVPESTKRWTIAVPHIAATTDTVVAFLSGRRPRITTTARNPTRLSETDRANFNERLGMALFDTIDQDRNTSLLTDSAEYVIHRGVLVYKALWLSPEERGEKRETYTPEIAVPDSQTASLLPTEEVVEEGDFPLFVQVIDPLDCFWTLGRDDRVIEFAQESVSTWDVLTDVFPDLSTHPDFRERLQSGVLERSAAAVKVVDYWNETQNVVLIDNLPYKIADHNYGEVPVVVELCNARIPRTAGQPGVKEGVPFCYSMLNAIRQFSRADSMSASYLEEAAIAVLVHEGIDPNGGSPYFQVAEGESEPQYRAVVDLSPGARMMPLFGSERLKYMDPPRIVDILQEFKSARQRDASLVSFPESILSGAQVADVSGYAYSQMKQAAMARVERPRMSLDRALSRLMNLCNRIIARNWDFLADDPMMLRLLTGSGQDEETMQVTLEDFQNAGIVKVEVQPEVPINQEQEWGMTTQLVMSGLLSKLQAIDRIGIVQDASKELERIAFEQFAQQDPQTMASLAMKYAQENGIQPVQPAQPPMAALPEGGTPPGMGMMPAESAGPTPGPPAPVPGGVPNSGPPLPAPAGGEQIPPELLALLGQGG